MRRLLGVCVRFLPVVAALTLCVLSVCGNFPVGCCHEDLRVGYDFQLRYNEGECVLEGKEPYRVWKGELKDGCHVPWNWSCVDKGEEHRYVHVYPPWTYTYLAPLLVLPKFTAADVWAAFEVLCTIGLFVFVFCFSFRRTGDPSCALLSVALSAIALPPVLHCLQYLNFGIPLAAASVAMACLLRRGRDASAGVCLGLMMVKPQISLLFVVPLLIGRKFKTVFVAAALCLLASVPPALMCGSDPLEMILAVLRSNDAFSHGLGGQWLFYDSAPVNMVLCLSAAALLSYVVAGSDDWMLKLLPCWLLCYRMVAFRSHDLCVLVPAFGVLSVMVFEKWRRNEGRTLVSALVFVDLMFTSAPVGFVGWFGFAAFAGILAWICLLLRHGEASRLRMATALFPFAFILAFLPQFCSHIFYFSALPSLVVMAFARRRWEMFVICAFQILAAVIQCLTFPYSTSVLNYLMVAALFICFHAVVRGKEVRS